jgi:uncharacterized membrane protein
MTQPSVPPGKSILGLDQNLVGALAYVLGLVTGIVILLVEPENRYVRFHAFQSTFTFLVVAVLFLMVMGLPVVSWLLATPFVLAVIVLWVFLMVKALNGERYKLPIVGDWADARVK